MEAFVTQKQWAQEVERALSGAGLPWRLTSAWIEQAGSTLCAGLADMRTGSERSIRLPGLVFRTHAERRVEIVRQVQASR